MSLPTNDTGTTHQAKQRRTGTKDFVNALSLSDDDEERFTCVSCIYIFRNEFNGIAEKDDDF